MTLIDRHWLPKKFLDVPEIGTLFRAAERNRLSLSTGARSATNPVNVSFRLDRQIVVHDVSYAIHIDAARCNIRGYQHLISPVFESLKCPRPCPLTLISVNCGTF
jgi:hypothetical protein